MSAKTPIIISIEGNIGAGKSSLLDKIQKKYATYDTTATEYKFCILKEPLNVWESVQDKCGDIENGFDVQNILQRFYKDPTKYAFSFQIMTYITRLKLLEDAIKAGNEIIIMERCLEIDENVFINMLNDDAKIDAFELQIYKLFINILRELTPPRKLNAVIYLDVKPAICLERIKERNRLGEENINTDYLYQCEFYYNEWLKTIDPAETKKIIINNETDDGNSAEIIFDYIDNFIHLK